MAQTGEAPKGSAAAVRCGRGNVSRRHRVALTQRLGMSMRTHPFLFAVPARWRKAGASAVEMGRAAGIRRVREPARGSQGRRSTLSIYFVVLVDINLFSLAPVSFPLLSIHLYEREVEILRRKCIRRVGVRLVLLCSIHKSPSTPLLLLSDVKKSGSASTATMAIPWLPSRPFDPTYRYATSWLVSPLILFLLRALFSLYLFTSILFFLIFDATHGRADDSRHYFSYFTSLCLWALAFYFAFAALHSGSYWATGRPILNRWPVGLQFAHAMYYTTITVFPILVTSERPPFFFGFDTRPIQACQGLANRCLFTSYSRLLGSHLQQPT